MSYKVSLSKKAKKQYENLDRHIRKKIKNNLQQLEDTPYEGFTLSGNYSDLRYIKLSHKGVGYRAVYDISDDENLVLVIFLGTRENFYKELRRYLRAHEKIT